MVEEDEHLLAHGTLRREHAFNFACLPHERHRALDDALDHLLGGCGVDAVKDPN